MTGAYFSVVALVTIKGNTMGGKFSSDKLNFNPHPSFRCFIIILK